MTEDLGLAVTWGWLNTYPEELVAKIGAGRFHALAIRPDGTVIEWGNVPKGIPEGLVATQVCGGDSYSVALRPDGTVVAWGGNYYGQCNVPAGLVATQIAAGDGSSMALRPDGSVVVWGRGSDVPADLRAIKIASGDFHSLAIREDGSVVAWGANGDGECNVPDGLTATQIAAGDRFSLAITTDGKLVGWGTQNYGRLVIPHATDALQIDALRLGGIALYDVEPFLGMPYAGVAPVDVKFNEYTSLNPTACLWDFGDGETSTERSPIHAYTEPGTYTVTLTITDDTGTNVKTRPDYIVVDHPIYVETYADLCKVGTGVDGWTMDAKYAQIADIQCPTGAERVSFKPIGNYNSRFTNETGRRPPTLVGG